MTTQEKPRIEFLEYLKSEFIEWWKERKHTKARRRKAKRTKKEQKYLKRELLGLSGRELADFLGYLIQIRGATNNFENEYGLLKIYSNYKDRAFRKMIGF